MASNPYYRFYQGRWWSTEEWAELKRHVALDIALTELLYPELFREQQEAYERLVSLLDKVKIVP